MERRDLEKLRRELEDFAEDLTVGLGRKERRLALRQYIRGLLLDGERKAVSPMAARLAEQGDAEALRQRLQQAVVVAKWDGALLFERVAQRLQAELPKLEAFVIDDTGFPKQGDHSVGVARQYSGTLGRRDRCQVAPSLHVANEQHSGCIGMQLYLPKSWADDEQRLKKAGVPQEVGFKPKWQIALDMLRRARDWGLPDYIVLADAAYGEVGDFRNQLCEMGLSYVLSVTNSALVWPPQSSPSVPPHSGKGRKPRRYVDEEHPPVQVAGVGQHRLSLLAGAERVQHQVVPVPDRLGRAREANGARVVGHHRHQHHLARLHVVDRDPQPSLDARPQVPAHEPCSEDANPVSVGPSFQEPVPRPGEPAAYNRRAVCLRERLVSCALPHLTWIPCNPHGPWPRQSCAQGFETQLRKESEP